MSMIIPSSIWFVKVKAVKRLIYLIIDLFIYIYYLFIYFKFNANTVDPHAFPHSAASHMGPHCSA